MFRQVQGTAASTSRAGIAAHFLLKQDNLDIDSLLFKPKQGTEASTSGEGMAARFLKEQDNIGIDFHSSGSSQ